MKKVLRKGLCMLAVILLVTACGKEDNTSQTDDGGNGEQKASCVYLQKYGLEIIKVSIQKEEYAYSLSILKGGDNMSFEADAKITAWTEEELVAYNKSKGTSYVSIAPDLYSITPEKISFTKDQKSLTVDVKLVPEKLLKVVEENNKAEYVIPLRLESEDVEVKANRRDLLIYISLDAPILKFASTEKTVSVQEESTSFNVSTVLNYKIDGKVSGSQWDFTSELVVPENALELITAYNQSHKANYELLPDEAYDLTDKVHYNINDTKAEATIVIDRNKIEVKYYILPLQLSAPSSKFVMRDNNVLYCLISRSYNNPIIALSAPDPTVIHAQDGCFYLYGTEDTRNMPIYCSKDMVNWEYKGTAFTNETRPTWEGDHSLWAPEIRYFNGQYVLYYSWAKWGDEWNSNVGVAVSDSPTGPFIDKGCVIDAQKMGVQNSIDQFFYEDGGKKYMFWGSFRGIYVTELTDDGLRVKTKADGTPVLKERICGNRFEATNIYKKGDYYYLFASIGTCCEGANSSYTTVVGRSKNILGPYLNKGGSDMLYDNYEVVLKGNSMWAGPGHNSIIQVDDNGVEWLIYHGYKKAEANNGRVVLLDRLYWTEDGCRMSRI
ncbi:family 43 glycosylhydrolase [Bacteroides sp.]|uniref:family 43 glycosylhydrolase n=1 Tax=Bacteroides sp. TaxID=29523 RepID=UPI002619CB86|nr:family 43 glycosylhydrolase [Bacteroides sp.]MDD3038365.1 family 43 glycosylhydrolase [Bacteroides sp.]